MSKNFKNITLSAIALSVLSACTSAQIKAEVDEDTKLSISKVDQVNQTLPTDGAIRGGSLYAEQQAKEQQNAKVLKRATRSWVGSKMVAVNADDKLPPVFHEQYKMNFADRGRPVDLGTVSARLSQMIGMPVRIQPDVFGVAKPGEGSNGVRALPPITSINGGQIVNNPAPSTLGGVAGATPMSVGSIDMQWDGTLVDFLNNLTDRLGLSWEYRDNAIVIMKFTTEFYEIATFPNDYDYTLNSGSTDQGGGVGGAAGGGAGGGAGNTGAVGGASGQGGRTPPPVATLTVKEKGKLETQKTMISVIQKMAEAVPGSEVIVADGTGRVVVRTSREVQSQIRDYIKSENASMLKQVHIQMDLYSVITNSADEKGVDWSILFNSLSQRYNFNTLSPQTLVGGAAGAVTFNIPQNAATDTNNRFGGSSAILSSLYQLGDNVQHRPISLVALNRQWARKARLTTTGYLASTTPSVGNVFGGAPGLPGLETDSITTGDQFAVMPFVLENNTVMLKMGLTLSELLSLFDVTTGSGATLQRVQTPNTSATTDQFTIALRPGEVMAITGLSREVSSYDERRLAEQASILAGGSKAFNTNRENFIVFIRAVIL